MKIGVLTDTHAGVRADSDVFAAYQKQFYCEEFFPYMDKHGIDTILHGGDYYDRRNGISFKTLKHDREAFVDKTEDKHVHLILGNHDVVFKNTNSLNSPELLLPERFNIIQEPTHLDFGKCRIGMVPWINAENYESTMEFIKNSDADILFGHFEFAGFEMNKGIVNEHGMKVGKEFDKFHAVWSGHFHTRSSKGNVHYLGSPFELTWADYDDPRGFHVFDTETLELEFIPSQLHMFHKLIWDNGCEDVPDLEGKYVKVVVHGKDDLYAFDQFVESLQQKNPEDLQIVDNNLMESVSLEDYDQEQFTKSTVHLIDEYIEGADLLKRTKTPVKKTMHELYQEAAAEGVE